MNKIVFGYFSIVCCQNINRLRSKGRLNYCEEEFSSAEEEEKNRPNRLNSCENPLL